MKSKKIFYIQNLVFNLPDDFDGTVTDALELIVEYRKSKQARNNRIQGSKLNIDDSHCTLENTYETLWNNDNNKLSFQPGMSFIENDQWATKLEDWRMK